MMVWLRRIFAVSLVTLCTGFAVHANAQTATSPYGLWLTENKRSVVSVEPCQENKAMLCGYIYWIIKDGMQFDEKNPDASLRNQPMCGLPILYGLQKTADGEWSNGKIYKADEGETYSGQLATRSNGTLKVSGYVGIPLFGKSQTWVRVNAKDYPKCTRAKR